MRKLFIKALIFFLSFLFFNTTSYGTEDINLDAFKIDNKQSIFNIKFDNMNINDIDEILENTSAKILKIIPKDKIYTAKDIIPNDENINKIITNAINTYKNLLIKNGYENESVYAELNGFEISNLILECNNNDLMKIGERVKYKLV